MIISIHYITPRPLLKANSPDSVSSDCFLGEECVGIRSCSAVVEQLQRAKATQDSVKRNEIIQAVRDKVKIFSDWNFFYHVSQGVRQEERTPCMLCFWATTRTTSSPDLCSCSKAAEEDRHLYKHLPRHRRHRVCPQQHHHPYQGVQLWRGGTWCILLGRQARAAVKVRRGKFKRFFDTPDILNLFSSR